MHPQKFQVVPLGFGGGGVGARYVGCGAWLRVSDGPLGGGVGMFLPGFTDCHLLSSFHFVVSEEFYLFFGCFSATILILCKSQTA